MTQSDAPSNTTDKRDQALPDPRKIYPDNYPGDQNNDDGTSKKTDGTNLLNKIFNYCHLEHEYSAKYYMRHDFFKKSFLPDSLMQKFGRDKDVTYS